MLTSKSVQEFLDETASSSPAPGGGSVSALAAALGAALTSMVCRLTIGKKKYAEVQSEMEDILQKSEDLRKRCTDLIDEDTLAFNKVMSAFALPKDTEQQKMRRDDEIQEATKKATLVPLRLMHLCEEALGLTARVAEKGNVNSISDAGVAALMLDAACKGAAFNVFINLSSLHDDNFARENSEAARKIQSNAEKQYDDVRHRVHSAMNLIP